MQGGGTDGAFQTGTPEGPSPAVMPVLSAQGGKGGPGPEHGGRSGPRRSAASCRQHPVGPRQGQRGRKGASTVWWHGWAENRGRNQEFSTSPLASCAFMEGFRAQRPRIRPTDLQSGSDTRS